MNLKKAIIASASTLALSVSASAFAADNGAQTQKQVTNAWTQCGIGAVIFNNSPVAAAISNIIWDLGTTAVTTLATSPETCKGVNVAAASFINESLDSIESDLAKGEGRHAIAMLALMGTEASQHAAVTKAIRSELAKDASFATLSHDEKAQKLYFVTQQQVANI